MKIIRILLAATLSLVILLSSVSCSFLSTPHSEALEQEIYDYLSEKYPGLEFEITGYTQDTFTSGKYVFKVFCKTTGIDFLVYRSSFLTTDSYTVTYANLAMEEMLVGVLGKDIMTDHAESLQWLDLFADGNSGYKFRDIDLEALPDSVVGINSVYRIVLHAQTTHDIFHSLKIITEKLDEAGVHCDNITFEWVQSDYTIVFTTDTCTIYYATEEELMTFIDYVDSTKQTDEFVTVSFVSRVKRVTVSTTDMDSDKFIPGFNEGNSGTGERPPNPHHPAMETEDNNNHAANEEESSSVNAVIE